MTVEHCEFDSNGNTQATNATHNIYIYGGTFSLRYSYVHDAVQAQNFHIRAHKSSIDYNWFARAKSYEGDLMSDDDEPAGPSTQEMLFRGNVVVQGNPNNKGQIIALFNDNELDKLTLALRMVNNTFVVAYPQSSVVHLSNEDGTTMNVEMSNNLISGGKPTEIDVAGKATVSGTNNWLATGTAPGALTGSVFGATAPFKNAAAKDFTLLPGSNAINAASGTVTGLPDREFSRTRRSRSSIASGRRPRTSARSSRRRPAPGSVRMIRLRRVDRALREIPELRTRPGVQRAPARPPPRRSARGEIPRPGRAAARRRTKAGARSGPALSGSAARAASPRSASPRCSFAGDAAADRHGHHWRRMTFAPTIRSTTRPTRLNHAAHASSVSASPVTICFSFRSALGASGESVTSTFAFSPFARAAMCTSISFAPGERSSTTKRRSDGRRSFAATMSRLIRVVDGRTGGVDGAIDAEGANGAVERLEHRTPVERRFDRTDRVNRVDRERPPGDVLPFELSRRPPPVLRFGARATCERRAIRLREGVMARDENLRRRRGRSLVR